MTSASVVVVVVGDRGFDYLDRARSDEFFARLKFETVEMLEIGTGDRVLELGCGTGEEVAAMGAAASDVFSVGVDLSPRNVIEAQRRHGRTAIAFVLADGHALPIRSGCLDGCRAERTLQHVADPARVVAEIARTLRRFGRVVLSEPDWASCVLVGADDLVSARVLASWILSNSNPRIGRSLPGVLVDAGLEPVDVRCEAVVYRSVQAAKDAFPLRRVADDATTQGVIDRPTADNWINDLSESSARGRFVFSVALFTAVGVKPRHAP
jgi:ubiquinone/menaquinone biosynthesis C-methylase UbiE